MDREPAIEPLAPAEILTRMGNEFNRLLAESSRPQAYKYMQKSLMENVGILVPVLMPMKDFIAAVTELEEYLKGSMASSDKSPLDLLSDWLQGKN